MALFEILSVCKGGGYHYVRTNPPHPKQNRMGLYPRHRVIMENVLGRLLLPKEIVHHRDGNKDNDDPANLEVMTWYAHSYHHAMEHVVDMVECVCPRCKATFEVKPSIARRRRKLVTGGEIYCSRRCGNLRN